MTENVRRFELLFDSIKGRSSKWRALVAEKRKRVRAKLIEAGCAEIPRDLHKLAGALGVGDVREVPLALRGRLVRESGGFAIEINSDLEGFQKRHVFAHELAHILVEDDNFELSQRERTARARGSSYHVVEKLCDECAAEMLLPLLWLRERLRRARPSLEALEQLAKNAQCSLEYAAERVRAEAIWQCTFLTCKVNDRGAWIVRSSPPGAADSLLLEIPKNKESSPIIRCHAERRRRIGRESLRFGDEVIFEQVECLPLEENTVFVMLNRETTEM